MRGDVQAAGTSAPHDGDVSLQAVGRALWRNKWPIVGPTLIMTAAAIVAVNWITPRYKSEARVLVESRENIFLRPEAEKLMIDRGTVDQETVTSQVQVVLSRELARQVVEELELRKTPEFNATLRERTFPVSLLRYLGLARDPLSMSPEERVLAAYYERLSAFAIDKSRVIAIEFQSADPELAARAANMIAEKYLAFQQMAKQDQARSAGKWLSGELDKLRRRVSEAEAKVEEFRAKANLFVGAHNVSLANQQLSELSSQVSAARAHKADAEARARLIRAALDGGKPIDLSEIGNSELIRRLAEQRVTLRAQLAEQSSTLLPQHPRIKELSAQIADLDQLIRAEAERIARSLENDAAVAGARLETLTANLDQLKRQAASTSDQDVQLRALEREAKAQRDLFESYLAKYREASARDSIAAAPADARIISRAVVSNVPYFPKKVPIVLIVALATCTLLTGFVTAGALLSGDAYRPEPFRTGPAAAAAAAVAARSPDARTRTTDAMTAAQPIAGPAGHAGDATQAASAIPAIDDVAAVLRQAGEGGRRVVVIGGAGSVNSNATAIVLTRALARGARAVLVNLAAHATDVAEISHDPAAPGIVDLVHGTASFGEIITRDKFSRAHLIGAGRREADAETLSESPFLPAAFGALAQSYDYLVINAGVLAGAGVSALAAMAQRAVLVGGELPQAAIDARAAELRAAGFVEVAVLTGPPPRLDHSASRPVAA
jgi:succinoglycan biosynthesis transport protein ExoP